VSDPKPQKLRSGKIGELPSGRTLAVNAADGEERLEIRAPGGEVEVAIVLTDDGPLIRLTGANLQISSTETISLNCKRLEMTTTEDLAIRTGGSLAIHSADEIRMKSAQQTFLDADYVNLNCLDRTGYHDEGQEELPAAADPAALPPADGD